MQLSNEPGGIQIPWCNTGVNRNTIPIPSQIGVTPGLASWTDGFPPLTLEPETSGGVPPFGQDFNGVLNALSLNQQWQTAGGLFTFSSTWSTANSGYPKGALLLKASGAGFWQNTVDGNTNNPDTLGPGSTSGWVDATAGRLINVQIFTASGNYTPTLGTNSVIVRVQGAGGGGGGSTTSASGYASAGGGGGSGAFAIARLTGSFGTISSPLSVTVGAAGTAGAAAGGTGGSGGASAFGSFISCPGGLGSVGCGQLNAVTANGGTTYTAAPTIGTLTGLLLWATKGAGGQYGLVVNGNGVGGPGAPSAFGPGGYVTNAAAGAAAQGYGAGGSGGATSQGGSGQVGGAGGAGFIVVEEYS